MHKRCELGTRRPPGRREELGITLHMHPALPVGPVPGSLFPGSCTITGGSRAPLCLLTLLLVRQGVWTACLRNSL